MRKSDKSETLSAETRLK